MPTLPPGVKPCLSAQHSPAKYVAADLCGLHYPRGLQMDPSGKSYMAETGSHFQEVIASTTVSGKGRQGSAFTYHLHGFPHEDQSVPPEVFSDNKQEAASSSFTAYFETLSPGVQGSYCTVPTSLLASVPTQLGVSEFSRISLATAISC